MSSRIRSTFGTTQTMRTANQENIPTILEGKNVQNDAVRLTKRPALVTTTNTISQQQAAVNAAAAAKEKSKLVKRPVLAERKPLVTARNPIRAGAKLPQPSSVTTSRPLSRTSGLPVPSSRLPTGSSTLTRKPSVLKSVENISLPKLEQLKITSEKTEDEQCDLPAFSEIEDIDANDRDNPFLVSPYVNDVYDYLRNLEARNPIKKDFLQGALITSSMRGTLVSWLVEVQVQYRLTPETLHQTIFIVDNYLQRTKDLPKNRLQLVGVTAMFIAAKYEETYCPDIEAFVYISDNAFTSGEVLAMEKKIVKCLDFAINRPLSIHFLRRYSKAAGATSIIHSYGKYFLELALVDYAFTHIPPSKVAAAATYIALSASKNSSLSCESTWTQELHYYSKYSFKVIKPIVNLLANTIQHVTASKKMNVIKVKYSQENFLRVAIATAIQPARIRELLEKQ
nr:PREDICTED: G2/mitotic-specific cyclin-B1 [Bemisia tabaci]